MSSSTESSPAAARRVQKRPRPVISCLECRRKKLKCDRLLPCRQCIKYGREKLCEYAPGQQPESRIENEAAERDSDHHLMSAGRQGEIDDLYERVKTLEQALQHGQQQQQQQHQNSHENHHIASTERVCSTKQSSGSRDLVRFHTDITLSYVSLAKERGLLLTLCSFLLRIPSLANGQTPSITRNCVTLLTTSRSFIHKCNRNLLVPMLVHQN